MQRWLMVGGMVLVSMPAFALKLFNDLDLSGNRITNVSAIRGTAANPMRLENVAQVQFANGQVMSNVTAGDLSFPDGMGGDPVIVYVDSTVRHTVPVGRTFYCISACGTPNDTFIYAATNNGPERTVWYLYYSGSYYGGSEYHMNVNTTFKTPLVFPERTVIRGSREVTLCGFELPRGAEIVHIYVTSSSTYTVPTGRTLYVLTMYSDADQNTLMCNWRGRSHSLWRFGFYSGYNFWQYGGQQWRSAYMNVPLAIPGGATLSTSSSSGMLLICYLR